MRVVVVEDEALVALALRMALEGLGHEVCAIAHSAADALDAAMAHGPDLLICDVNLGRGGNGVEVAADAHRRWGLRTIFVSGSIDGALRSATRGFEPLGFVHKPFSTSRLAGLLDGITLGLGRPEPAASAELDGALVPA